MIERTRHGIFGYSEVQDEYFHAVAGWMSRHHNWNIENTTLQDMIDWKKRKNEMEHKNEIKYKNGTGV